MIAPCKERYDKPRQHIKKQRHHFANKGLFSQSYGIPRSHVWMWDLDLQEGWEPKNLCFWTVVLVKTLESPSDDKEIKSVNPKGNEPWIFIGRIDTEDDAPIHCLPDAKKMTFWKRPWCWEKNGRQKRRGWQRMRWSDRITNSMDMNLSNLWEIVENGKAWYAVVQSHKESNMT